MRTATKDDLPLILHLAKSVHELSPYRIIPYDTATTRDTVLDCLKTGVVILSGETGILIAKAIRPHFSTETLASELLWHSFETGRKKILDEADLWNAFEYWAKFVAKVHYILGGKFGDGRFMEKRGYAPVETSYITRIR